MPFSHVIPTSPKPFLPFRFSDQNIVSNVFRTRGTWLWYYATSWKVADSRPCDVNFSIYLVLPAVPGPGVHSASNRNEHQKQKKSIFRLTTLPPSISRLSIQCEILKISQTYRPPRPVTYQTYVKCLALKRGNQIWLNVHLEKRRSHW
jgi:hypothetical protein